MIYFEAGTVQIPRHSNENAGHLTLVNELTDERLEFQVEDMSEDTRYYLIDMSDVTDLPNGTYRYELGPRAGQVSEVGLWQVGDYVSVSPTYNERKQNIVYEG